MEHPRVEVTFSDAGVEYVSSTGVRKHSWDKIEQLKETRGFVIFMHGKLPLLSLPKAPMTPDILSFIHAKVANQSAQRTPGKSHFPPAESGARGP
jgi:hypothetical protein